MEEESWRRHLGGGIMEEGFGRNLGGFWEAFRSPGRHPEAPQEAPRRHPGQPRRPEASWRQSVSKHMCFSDKSGATDLLACTGATRPSRSPQQGSKSWRTRTWELGGSHTPKSLREAARNPTVEHCLGNILVFV